MPFSDKYHETAHRSKELRKQLDEARERYDSTKSPEDLAALEDAHGKYQRHLGEVRKATEESLRGSHEEALQKAKEAIEASEGEKNEEVPTLEELTTKITPENRHEEIDFGIKGKEKI